MGVILNPSYRRLKGDEYYCDLHVQPVEGASVKMLLTTGEVDGMLESLGYGRMTNIKLALHGKPCIYLERNGEPYEFVGLVPVPPSKG